MEEQTKKANIEMPEAKRNLAVVEDLDSLSEFELARRCSKTWSMEQE